MRGMAIKAMKSFLYGLPFGFASPVPGISAGTMAILLNVYESFFTAISWSYIKKNLAGTFFFLAGWAVGLLGISNLMMYLFENHRQLVSFCFIGLIAGCLPMIYVKATSGIKPVEPFKKIKPTNVFFFFIALVCMVSLAFFADDINVNNTLEQLGGVSLPLLTQIFIASFISSMAMLIPGVGGSLMMFVFGIYALYIEAIATLHPVLIAVFGTSMVLGVLAGIVITKKLLERFAQALYFAILGFIIGSLLFIYPGFSLDMEGLLSVLSALAFMVFAYRLSKKG
jgi:putative membrane protein